MKINNHSLPLKATGCQDWQAFEDSCCCQVSCRAFAAYTPSLRSSVIPRSLHSLVNGFETQPQISHLFRGGVEIGFKIMNLSIDVIKGKQAGSVYIGRPSVLGNRFEMDKNGIKKDGTRAEVIEKFRLDLWEDFKVKGVKYRECVRLAKLAKGGKNLKLSCWCAPLGCHGDVIKNAVKWLIECGVV